MAWWKNTWELCDKRHCTKLAERGQLLTLHFTLHMYYFVQQLSPETATIYIILLLVRS